MGYGSLQRLLRHEYLSQVASHLHPLQPLGYDKEDTLTQVGEKLQAVISLQGHGRDAVAFVLKHYNSSTSAHPQALGLIGMPSLKRQDPQVCPPTSARTHRYAQPKRQDPQVSSSTPIHYSASPLHEQTLAC
jgi:hypothetical protein